MRTSIVVLPFLVTLAILSPAAAQTGEIPSLNATVSGLRFFPTPYEMVPVDEREYFNRFPHWDTQFVGWELSLKFPALGKSHNFVAEAVWYRPNGRVLARQTVSHVIEPDWTSSYSQDSWGWERSGQWSPGTYRLDVFVEGSKIASAPFTITSQSSNAIRAYNDGIKKSKAGDYTAAIASYDKAVRIDPDFVEAITNRCYAKLLQNNLAGALADCDQALAIEPEISKAYCWRGDVALMQKRYDQASTDYTRAIQLDPNSGGAYLGRGRARFEKGEYKAAWQDVDRSQSLGADFISGEIEKIRSAAEKAEKATRASTPPRSSPDIDRPMKRLRTNYALNETVLHAPKDALSSNGSIRRDHTVALEAFFELVFRYQECLVPGTAWPDTSKTPDYSVVPQDGLPSDSVNFSRYKEDCDARRNGLEWREGTIKIPLAKVDIESVKSNDVSGSGEATIGFALEEETKIPQSKLFLHCSDTGACGEMIADIKALAVLAKAASGQTVPLLPERNVQRGDHGK